ncbi:MAG: hypothetical protein GWN58_00410, partial [Anaerolineae bacterium]|nr:hypothetical protein [Anaerolineae bacterium]
MRRQAGDPARWRRRAARVALLALLCLLAGVPAKPLVDLGPQQAVRSLNPQMGVHT